MSMKKLAAAILMVALGVGVSLPMYALPSNNNFKMSRADRKAIKKQQKAQKKYAKAQKKAQNRMIKKDRKNIHLPKHY
jgi:uncharacterized protein HemX